MTGEILELIAQKLPAEHISEDADLLEEGILDSVTLVQLIVCLEQRFGVRIELNELEIDDLRSVRSIAGVVTKLQATQGSTRQPEEELWLTI